MIFRNRDDSIWTAVKLSRCFTLTHLLTFKLNVMQNEELYPDLVDYIYRYQGTFMTADEKVAAGRIIPTAEDPRERLYEVRKLKLEMLVNDNETAKQMLADGFDVFKNRVVNRIYNEHKNELSLNLCPRCSKIARTPWAKQCRFCFYSWHSQ